MDAPRSTQHSKPPSFLQGIPLQSFASASITQCPTSISIPNTNRNGISIEGSRVGTSTSRAALSSITLDDYNLMSMGYKPVLSRSLSSITLLGITLTSSNVLCGVVALYGLPLTNGGPAWATWSYLVVGIMSCAVSLCLAELASAYPTTAGVHHWVYQLAPSSRKPFLTWMTGWLAVAGAVASASSVAFYFSSILGQILYTIHRVALTPGMLVMFHLGAVIVWQILNLFPVRGFGYISSFSGVYIVGITVAVSVILLSSSLPEDVSMKDVPFTAFLNYSGNPSTLYAGLSSSLMAAFVFCPQDSVVRMAEEIKHPERIIPKLITSLSVSNIVLGLPLVIGLGYGILQPMKGLLDEAVPAVRVILVSLGRPLGTIFISLILTAIFFTGLARLSMATRVAYAFSRDAGLPKSSYWNHLHAQRRTPHRVSWLVTAACMAGIFPFYWGDNNAFHWIASLGCIATNMSFVVPLWLMLTRTGSLNHTPGPFRIHVFSRTLYTASILWLILISGILMLPYTFPLTRGNFNYASAATLGIVIIASISWLKAKYRFTGSAKVGSQALTSSCHHSRRSSHQSHYQRDSLYHPHHYHDNNQYQRHLHPNRVLPLTPSLTEDRQLLSSSQSPSSIGPQKPSSLLPVQSMCSSSDRTHSQGIVGYDYLKSEDGPWFAHTSSRSHSPRTLGPDLSSPGYPLHKGYPTPVLDIPVRISQEMTSRETRNTKFLSRVPSDTSLSISGTRSSDLQTSGRPMTDSVIPEISVAPPTTISSGDSQVTEERSLSSEEPPVPALEVEDCDTKWNADTAGALPLTRPPNATLSIFPNLSPTTTTSPTGSNSASRHSSWTMSEQDYFGASLSQNAIHDEDPGQDAQILKPVRPSLERRYANSPAPRRIVHTKQEEEDGMMKIMDLKVDDSFGEEYLHQYPVISAFQSTRNLFRVPLSTTQGTSSPQLSPTGRSPTLMNDKTSVRSKSSPSLEHTIEKRDQAIAQWAQEQNKVNGRRIDKRRTRALQELQRSRGSEVVDDDEATLDRRLRAQGQNDVQGTLGSIAKSPKNYP